MFTKLFWIDIPRTCSVIFDMRSWISVIGIHLNGSFLVRVCRCVDSHLHEHLNESDTSGILKICAFSDSNHRLSFASQALCPLSHCRAAHCLHAMLSIYVVITLYCIHYTNAIPEDEFLWYCEYDNCIILIGIRDLWIIKIWEKYVILY